MGLEVRFNKTEHLHENAQFDRVALHLVPFFEEQEWDGLLIGNPVSEDYPRFRADAILLYTNGLIIVDFKDYQGEIVMPLNDEDFRTDTWFNNTEDGNRIKIEAGNNHTNPYKQLDRYRGVMKGIVQDDSLLRYVMNTKMICALNVFSGPITLNRYTSRKVPYYQLKSELDLHNFLNQYASPNKFEEAIGNIFKTLFPAQEWKGDLSIDPNTYYKKQTVNHKQIDKDLVPALEEFYGSNESGILVLESMEQGLRDEWMKMANTFALENDSDTDIWCHSSRIARKINLRTYFDVHSLYSIIYGGKVSDNNEKIEEELEIIIYDDHCEDEVYTGYYEEGPVLEKVKLKKVVATSENKDKVLRRELLEEFIKDPKVKNGLVEIEKRDQFDLISQCAQGASVDIKYLYNNDVKDLRLPNQLKNTQTGKFYVNKVVEKDGKKTVFLIDEAGKNMLVLNGAALKDGKMTQNWSLRKLKEGVDRNTVYKYNDPEVTGANIFIAPTSVRINKP